MVKVLSPTEELTLTIGGQILATGQRGAAQRAPRPVCLVRCPGQTFLSTLRRKLKSGKLAWQFASYHGPKPINRNPLPSPPMLRSIHLTFGANRQQPALSFAPGPMTIFVGPNNAGKSLVLREIEGYSEAGGVPNWKILAALDVEFPARDDAEKLIRRRQFSRPGQAPLPEGDVVLAKLDPANSGHPETKIVNMPDLLTNIERWRSAQTSAVQGAENQSWSGVFPHFLSYFTIRLDGKTRLGLADPRPGGDLNDQPENHLTSLFVNDYARAKLRSITQSAFNLSFVIDPTSLGMLRVRMSVRPPEDTLEEQALDQRARDFHRNAHDIAELSDGVKAFTGISAVLLSSDFRLILVDEPEAFLHPPLANKLGATMTELAVERTANVFAATHSADFLLGCVETGPQVNIVRLTYQEGQPTARLLPAMKVRELMHDPLLRSAGVLSALFHAGAVVCEADADRAFYQEINRRLASSGALAIRDSLFLNAQNKQTIRRISQPLREMGIPAAAVVDIDIIKGGDDFKQLLKASYVPEGLAHSWGSLRGNVEAEFKKSEQDMKRGGVNRLDPETQESAVTLITQLEQYGIFVVQHGELEGWLASLGVQAHKSNWLPAIFEQMGSDPSAAGYVQPSADDVWEFVLRIALWVNNPARKGMPS
jgi:ABC-type hemin transport system ATPase subunit